MGWSLTHIKKLKAGGKIRDYKFTDNGPSDQLKKILEENEVPTGLKHIKRELEEANIPFLTEYEFAEDRKFRFDIALLPLMIALEYEGLMSKKSRHTTVSGYSKDAEKYNLAQQLGWRVYRYTALNYKEFTVEIIK